MHSENRPASYDPAWRARYAEQIVDSAAAVAEIRPGQRVFIGTGCAQPQELVRALTARSAELTDTEIVHLLTLGEAPYAHHELIAHFKVNSFFISENVRDIIQEGLGDYTPIFLSDIPRLFRSGRLPLDAALIQVSPPDERGMCSFGISVDINKSAAENARLVIAEVNPLMPRTLGDSFIHVHDIDCLVPVESPLLEISPPSLNEVTERIGEYVAALVEDGSTMELGIGKIPHAVLGYLGRKKDLGIHTEMLTDSVIDLVEQGVINGSRKTLDQGQIVASFCMGTRRLYDYIDNNPSFAFHPTEYVNDPFLISRQHRMVAINIALEVDLTGQVCADSLGTRFYSGIGGQVDFNRGAARAEHGKAIIALPSTARGGEISRIVTYLSPGAGVVTTRGDVHYVVTEHGVAYLHGKSIQERALALISIADPRFRPRLVREALGAKYLRQNLADLEGRIHVGPRELTTSMLLDDGTQVSVRPMHPTDEPGVRELFYNLSQQAIYYRFMSHLKRIPEQRIQNFVYIDHRNDVAIVAYRPEAHGDEILAIGRYYLDPTTNRAEVAFTVRDEWHNRGIGSFLLRYLINIARRNGISGFTAEILTENKAMQAVMQKTGHAVRTRREGGVVHMELDF
jgi:acyl-CoA hydrolase/GNAT superfamily N-acetyltransferase